MYLQNYHKHTSYSHRYNKDSPVTHMDYFKYYGELAKQGIPTIYSTVEHGWQSPYFRIYDDLDKFNKKMAEDNLNYVPIKFVFGTEGYWVKDRFAQDSSNCHIVLLAKNDNGRKKINRIIYESFKSGYYYKNRMDLDLLLQLPKDDVMVTTACVAFWNKYGDIDNVVLKLNEHFTSFYLEVQANNTPNQKELNKHILDLHYKYNIPLIAGLDSHVIRPEQMQDREYLLLSNHIKYEDEEGWYMDVPSVDELIRRFEEQNVLPIEAINEAIQNTNVCLDFDDIVLDKSIKVPVAKRYQGWTQEQRNNELKRIVNEEWQRQYNDMNLDKLDEYYKEIQDNVKEVLACNMADYFLDDYWIMKRGIERYGGILTPSGRGSGVSFFLNKLLGFTKVDKINADVIMYAERFLTATRILESHTPPDIDMNISEREPFIKAQIDELGEDSTFDLLACGTLKYKSAFKMFARANDIEPALADAVSKQITSYEEALKHKEDDEEIDIYDYVDKEKYGYLIEGCQTYRGIIDNLKAHPCFPKGTLVMTSNGYKNIEDITTNDKVLTIDNTFKQVNAVMKNHSDDIYEVSISGSPIFEATGNHPFYVASEKHKVLSNKRWCDVRNLKKGDVVGVAINQNTILPQLTFVDSSNYDFWWCIGRWFGDGWRSHTVRKSGKKKGKLIRDVIICCNKKDDELQEIISHLTWCKYRIVEERTVYKIYLTYLEDGFKGLWSWLGQFGDYATGKHFTNTIFDLPIDYLKTFINGYLSADGCKQGKWYSLKTVSKELAYGLEHCIYKCYHTPVSISICKTNGTEIIEGRQVKAHNRYIVRFDTKSHLQDRSFYSDGYMWMKIKGVIKINKECAVYNLNVENNHTYTVYNYIVHNCGTIAYNYGDVIEDVGVIMVKSESQGDKAKEIFVAVIESHDIDSFGILKNDFLVVDSIGLTYDIYKEIGMKPMSVNELMVAIKDDKETWDIYAKGLTMCINQVEQIKSTEKVMRYKPKNIAELTQFVAGIRPSFQSMYKTFENREHFEYGIKAFDSLIQDEFCNSSFILYQEHLMKVLGFAGFPMSETYTIIKAISKKKKEVIAGAEKKFIPNFTQAILDTKETSDINEAKEYAKQVWEIIKSSAQYGFNSAHAYSMAIDSVTLAWLKAHYPLEFYKVCLQRYTNKGDKNKVIALKAEMNKLGIKLNPIKFGDDNRTFTINKENGSINQTIQSLKNVQKIAPQILYEMSQKNYPSLFHIFKDLKASELNKKSLDIIFKLDYFSEYGDINYILQQWEVYNKVADIYEKIKTAKKLTKATYEPYFDTSELAKYGKETAKQIAVEDSDGLYKAVLIEYPRLTKEIEKSVPYTPITQLEKMVYQCAYNGACDIVDETQKDNIFIVSSVEENKYGTPFITMIQCNNGQTITFKGNKRAYSDNKCDSGDVIMCYITKQPKRVKNENDEWIDTGDEEVIIKDYAIVRKFEMS